MRVERNERVLVTTLTKKMSEDLSQYLLEMGFKTRYLHSEIDTLERIQIIRDLRLGEYDVLVGVNLLREGLDLPEVSLVAILDADKEGFLRGETSLIQTIGRAARNVDGTVLMYADKETRAMRAAISETDRAGGRSSSPTTSEHGITAATIVKGISDIAEFLQAESKVPRGRKRRTAKRGDGRRCPQHELERMVVELEEEMIAAADELRFEYAAQLRDELRELRRDLQEIRAEEAPGEHPSAGSETPQRRHSLGWPPWSSIARQSNAGTSRSAAGDMTRRRSMPTCAHSPPSSRNCSAPRSAAAPTSRSPRPPETRSRASSRPPRPPPAEIERQALDSARQVREAADREAETHARAGDREGPRARRRRSPRWPRRLLERVGSMDGEVNALIESLRAGAGRLAADLSAVEAGMGELYDAASGRAGAAGARGRRRSRPSCRRRARAAWHRELRARPRRSRNSAAAAPAQDGGRPATSTAPA